MRAVPRAGLLLLLALAACSRLGACGSSKVAELLEGNGKVERDFAARVGQWSQAAPHAEFEFGDGLRTGADATALLRVGRSGRMRVQSDTTLRFAASSPDQVASAAKGVAPQIDVESGGAVLEVGEDALPLRTARGGAVLRAGTRMKLERAEAGTRYKVLIGGVDFRAEDGKSRSVAAGEALVVGIGLAVLESKEDVEKAERAADPARVAHEPAARGPAPQTEPPAPGQQVALTAAAATPLDVGADERVPEAKADSPQAAARERGGALLPDKPERPEHPEVSAMVGQGFRIYDPAPPTAVRLALGKHCPDGAELQIPGRAAVRGARDIDLMLPAGIHRYTVHCVEGDVVAQRAAAEATILVLRSDGVRALPTRPVENEVDTDGRRYTLMYQNLKPIVHVRWPGAPAANGYALQLVLPSGERKSLRAKEPRYTLEPSTLGEGVHTVQFEASGATHAQSKPTQIAITFDNAAPTASLTRPPPQGFVRGDKITVSGVAIEGSQVSIGGKPVKLDPQQRFTTEVELPPEEHTLVVRFQNRKYGVHYYVRREAGSPR